MGITNGGKCLHHFTGVTFSMLRAVLPVQQQTLQSFWNRMIVGLDFGLLLTNIPFWHCSVYYRQFGSKDVKV